MAAGFVVAAFGDRVLKARIRSSPCTCWLAILDLSSGNIAGCAGLTCALPHRRMMRSPRSRRRTNVLRRSGSRSHAGAASAGPGQLWRQSPYWPVFLLGRLSHGRDGGTTDAPRKRHGKCGGCASSRAFASRRTWRVTCPCDLGCHRVELSSCRAVPGEHRTPLPNGTDQPATPAPERHVRTRSCGGS